MLHIIWGILKLAGIIIGVLLLILLAVIFSVLLVPVRYQVRAAKENTVLEAEAKVNWLLHLVSLAVSVGKGQKLSVTIRLFGFRLPFFQGRDGGPKRKKKKKQKKQKNQKKRTSADASFQKDAGNGGGTRTGPEPEISESSGAVPEPEISESSGTVPEPEISESSGAMPEAGTANDTGRMNSTVQPEITERTYDKESEATAGDYDKESAGAAERTYDKESEATAERTYDEESAGTAERADDEEPPEAAEQVDAAEPEESFRDKMCEAAGKFRNIRFKVQSICDKIRQIPGRIRKLFQAAAAVPGKLRGLFERAGGILQKPSMLLDLMEEYEIWDVLKMMKRQLLYLFRHCGLRRIRGYLDFGTGDPALTGQLAGVIYLLLPARAEGFSVQPDFYEARLETEFVCTGHIRGIHFACVVIRTLKDRKVRRIIRRFIKKGE